MTTRRRAGATVLIISDRDVFATALRVALRGRDVRTRHLAGSGGRVPRRPGSAHRVALVDLPSGMLTGERPEQWVRCAAELARESVTTVVLHDPEDRPVADDMVAAGASAAVANSAPWGALLLELERMARRPPTPWPRAAARRRRRPSTGRGVNRPTGPPRDA